MVGNSFDRLLRLVVHGLIILGSLATSIAQISQFSAILVFIIIFYLIGQSTRVGLLKPMGFIPTDLRMWERIVIDILLSSIITSFLSVLLCSLWSVSLTFPIVITLIVVMDVIEIVSKDEGSLELDEVIARIKEQQAIAMAALACIIWGVIVILWREQWFPFPETSASDVFKHLYAINDIVQNNGASYLFLDYPFRFHAMVSVIVIASGVDPYVLLFYGSYFAYPISIATVFGLLYSITKNLNISLVASLFFPFVDEAGALLGPHYLFPSTYAFVITFLIMILVQQNANRGFYLIIGLASYVLVAIVYPYVILGTLPALLYFGTRASDRYLKRKYISVLLLVGTIGGLMIEFTYYGILPLLGYDIAYLDWGVYFLSIAPNLELQIDIFLRAYLIPQICLLAIGLIALFLETRNIQFKLIEDHENARGILQLSLLYLVAFFLPILTATRVEMYIRPLLVLSISYGAFIIALLLIRGISRARNLQMPSNLPTRAEFWVIVVILLTAATLPTAVNMEGHIRWAPHSPVMDEYLAFEWISAHTPEDAYILTDPATGYIMRGFTTLNCSTSIILNGFPTEYTSATPLGELIFKFLNSSSDEDTQLLEEIDSLVGDVDYIVISPRTSYWLASMRQGRDSHVAVYATSIPIDDPAWIKFAEPRYEYVQSFGFVHILIKNDVYLPYYDDMQNNTGWYATDDDMISFEDGTLSYSHSNDSAYWFSFYTNTPSFDDQENLYLEIRWRSNVTGMEGKVFGYHGNERSGGIAFATDFIYPNQNWSAQIWDLSHMPIYYEGNLESIELSFQNLTNNWTLYVDELKIYSTHEIDYIPKDIKIVYQVFNFENLSDWSADTGAVVQTDGDIVNVSNPTDIASWHHFYTSNISFKEQENLYIGARYRFSTTNVSFRIEGFAAKDMLGGYSFYSDYVYPSPEWTVGAWAIKETPGYTNGEFQSLSFSVISNTTDWILYIDRVEIYEFEREVQSSSLANPNGTTNELFSRSALTKRNSNCSTSWLGISNPSNARTRISESAEGKRQILLDITIGKEKDPLLLSPSVECLLLSNHHTQD